MKDYGHPAMFPEELPRRLMKLFSYKNDIVLDPFNGTGTTTLVAWKLGRRFIGIDVSQQYCDLAFRRVTAAADGAERASAYPPPSLVALKGLAGDEQFTNKSQVH
jgi:site-specific DNA-methyltransferase (adenine-specific)